MAADTRTPAKGGKDRLGLWIGLALGALILCYVGVLEMSRPHVSGDRLRYDQLVELAQSGMLVNAHILDEDAYVVGSYISETPEFGAEATPKAYNAPLIRGTQRDLLNLFIESRVPVTVDQQVGKRVVSLASILLPSLMLVTLFVYLILSYRRGTGLFGIRSGARRFTAEAGAAGFADVAGQDAAITELRELALFLSDPERFAAVGAQIPRGVLLYGPPGCGKTLLARALAGETGAAFYSISGSDFVEMYAGVGASRVRDLFREARENAPAIVFVDELDAVGRRRGEAGSGSREEQEQALNQILTEMDGFASTSGVIIVGATNRPDVLDPALLRPGRFDRTIGLERPDLDGRHKILQVHVGVRPLADDVDLLPVAEAAVGLSGADLASIVNEAAILAARAGDDVIGQAHLHAAVQRILEAPERQRRLSLRSRDVGHRYAGGTDRVTFADVAGLDEVVEELSEVRAYLAEPGRFVEMGARVPRGVLLDGPPGCGKTLLARALAGESNAAFLYVAASEFVERLAGEGAARVRDLFAEAQSLAPAIVFIDEIDAIGAHRSTSSMDREREQTLNQILISLDGFEARSGVIAIAATNRPDILDPALVRPGRFDRHVSIGLPDRARRREILERHAQGKPLADDVDLDAVARLTNGFAGADLANVLNEAVLLAARQRMAQVPMRVVDDALERAVLGVAPAGRLMDPQERAMVAYHEAGHALVGRALPGAPVPHRLSIVPKGPALGATWGADTHDRAVHSRSALMNRMAALLGGRVAEEQVFGEPGSGAADDLARVAETARWMVAELGMSAALGPLTYPGRSGTDGQQRVYSQQVLTSVDTETRRLVEEAHVMARDLLSASRPTLDRVAEALLERETLTAAELEELITAAPAPPGPVTATLGRG